MTFLNPFLLFALPLIALPILIHLINQRRHRTVEWGAMMFLLSAKKMSKGMARLKHVLIMTARMLAIAGLVFAVCRPMATGWFGAITGGKPETVIVVLDRSASMQQQQLASGKSKLNTGLQKIVDMIKAFDGAKRVVLIESTQGEPIEISSPAALLDFPKTSPTDAAANLPGMLEAAMQYVADNETGRTDIWVCSDASQNDWSPESGRWEALRSGFSEKEGIRFHVLNFAESPLENIAISVQKSERISSDLGTELQLDLTIKRGKDFSELTQIPLEITINGVRSVVNIEMDNEEYSLVGHRIPLDAGVNSGWGKVELPADSNPSDNVFYFAFAEKEDYQTVIVSDTEPLVRSLKIAAQSALGVDQGYAAKIIGSDQLEEIDWNQTALLVWQSPLPVGLQAKQVRRFVEQGRTVLFLPPDHDNDNEFEGVSWNGWERLPDDDEQDVAFWRNEDDLLCQTRRGKALSLQKEQVYQYCKISGNGRVLAKLKNNVPLLLKRTTDAGELYFLTTLPAGSHSSLARRGEVLFAIIHRAIAKGAASIGRAKQVTAGTTVSQQVEPLPNIGSDATGLTETKPFRAGVYGNETQLIAVNRPALEDTSSAVSNSEIESLFKGLDVHIIDDHLGSEKSLASEIWKSFIALMGAALLLEAIVSLPPKPETTEPLGQITTGVAA